MVVVVAACESGDWFTLGGVRGVLKAPVDSFWSRSNISCSSLGRRGGAAPLPKGLVLSSATRRLYEDVKERRDEGRRARRLVCAMARGSMLIRKAFILPDHSCV